MARREGLKAASMRGKKRLWNSEMSWEVAVKGNTMLKYSKGKWRDMQGKIIATENPQNNECEAGETVTIAGDLDIATKDLIVAAWCTKIWQSNNKVSLVRTLMNGEGMLRFSLGTIEP